MTEPDKERAEAVAGPRLQSAYRALGAEEPSRALDEAILAAARRSAQPWTRRWAVPLSLAAVVVLSVTVTLRIQHEQPGIEVPASAPAKKDLAQADRPATAVPPTQAPAGADRLAAAAPPTQTPARPAADAAVRAPQPEISSPQPKVSSLREADAFPRSSQDRAPAENRAKEEEAPAPALLAEKQVASEALAKRADARSEVGAAAGSVAAPPALARPAPAAPAPAMRPMQRDRMAAEQAAGERPALTPEQELERIAGLRKEQKHDEADKALAEFRKRYPEFKIPPAMLERVERR